VCVCVCVCMRIYVCAAFFFLVCVRVCVCALCVPVCAWGVFVRACVRACVHACVCLSQILKPCDWGHLQFKHPTPEALGLYGHAFLNGGNLTPLTGASRPFSESLQAFGSGWRWSTVKSPSSFWKIKLGILYTYIYTFTLVSTPQV
jgi:hypothetical protein